MQHEDRAQPGQNQKSGAFVAPTFHVKTTHFTPGSRAPITSFQPPYPTTGSIEFLETALKNLLPEDAKIEKLAEGFTWSEGPVWLERESRLVFSDVPENVAYQWHPDEGVTIYLEPSGYTGEHYSGLECGSNGLTVDLQGRLVLCQQGLRQIARLDDDGRSFITVVDRFEGRRLNSPNDLCYDRKGNLYFTDPPYGAPHGAVLELGFYGVFRLAVDGQLTVITRELNRPNGLALSPDESLLYVGNSEHDRPIILVFPLAKDDTVGPSKVFWDGAELMSRTSRIGCLDGMKVDAQGNLWATGPGGVLILNPSGRHLGSILTTRRTGNCCFGGPDGHTLFIAADNTLLKIETKTRSAGVGVSR